MIENAKKRCTKCQEEKDREAFGKTAKGTLQSWCKVCTGQASNAWHKQRPEWRRNANLKHNHRITTEEYNALLERQGGNCAACGLADTALHYGKPRSLAVDHCHQTGKLRGLLCGKCNQALGLLDDSPEKIEALLKYIQERK